MHSQKKRQSNWRLNWSFIQKRSLALFSKQTNVDLNKRLVIFDIKDLGKQLKPFGMLVVLDQIWNRITLNRESGIRTWLYIDELQLLFTNEYSENYFFELWSRARKWGLYRQGSPKMSRRYYCRI